MEFSLSSSELNELINEEDERAGIICIWGDSGIGKTTLCFNAALSVLSKGKKVIYLNTKPEFKTERLQQIKEFYPKFDIFNLLIFNIKSYNHLILTVMDIENLILNEIKLLGKANIGLIVIDTATTLLQLTMNFDVIRKKNELIAERKRVDEQLKDEVEEHLEPDESQEIPNPSTKKRRLLPKEDQNSADFNQKLQSLLNTILATLQNIHDTYGIPILITNRMTIRSLESDNRVVEKGSFANTINYWVKTSIKIERTAKTGYRNIIIDKHPRNNMKKINSKLTIKGFE
jgi:hypothetical protein